MKSPSTPVKKKINVIVAFHSTEVAAVSLLAKEIIIGDI